MPSIQLRPFVRPDRDQITALVNAHIGAVVPNASVSTQALLSLMERDPGEFIVDPWVRERATLVAEQRGRIVAALARLGGQLTGTLHAQRGEACAPAIWDALARVAGRVIFDGFPTGVSVTRAMVHGGPFPATSDGRSTSVGGRAIERFARLICFQDAPGSLLPEELRNGNPAAIWRVVNGERTRS